MITGIVKYLNTVTLSNNLPQIIAALSRLNRIPELPQIILCNHHYSPTFEEE
jgi:hypothetical protein